MKNNIPTASNQRRAIEVDMSSVAITIRLREAGELNQLGVSLARAKPCPPPNATPVSDATDSLHPTRRQP